MALLTSDVVLDEAMERYELNTVIMKMADGRYDSAWQESPTKGDHITIRLPIYARGRRGEQADPQVIDERPATLYIPAAFGSDSLLTDRQLSMDLYDFKSQVLEPHIDRISSDVANEACKQVFLQTGNFVGTPGVVPTSLTTYQDANRILIQGGTPGGLAAVAQLVDANMDQKATAAGLTFFNPPDTIAKQYEIGTMGIFGGAMWSLEQGLYQHTIGTCTGTPLVSAANQSGNTITTTGWTASVTQVLKAGDKVAFSGSYMTNPVNQRTYVDLQYFSVAADVNSDSSGNATITLVTALEWGTPYANVSALPALNAPVYVWGVTGPTPLAAIAGVSTTLGIRMHKSALLYASPNLELPGDVDKLSGRTRSNRMKIGMRIWRASDVKSGERITRLDMLCGFLVAQNRKACLICSA